MSVSLPDLPPRLTIKFHLQAGRLLVLAGCRRLEGDAVGHGYDVFNAIWGISEFRKSCLVRTALYGERNQSRNEGQTAGWGNKHMKSLSEASPTPLPPQDPLVQRDGYIFACKDWLLSVIEVQDAFH